LGSRVRDTSGAVIVLGRVQLLLGRVDGRVQGVRVQKVPAPVIISLALVFYLTLTATPWPMQCTFTRLPMPLPLPLPHQRQNRHNKTERQEARKTRQQDTAEREGKTGTLNATLPRTSLLRPSKLPFYCHHHGWVTTHGWPSGHGGHHGDTCMFMKSRPSEFTPAMLATCTPDAVPNNHPGSANVQRTNVLPLPQCCPCTLPPCLVYPHNPFPPPYHVRQ
jgi:hypothetical protein